MFFLLAFLIPYANIKTAYWRTCHTATLTNFLCYTPVFNSQIQGKPALWDFPNIVSGLSHRIHPSGYSCTASVYYSPATRILLLAYLSWYTAQHCWRLSVSSSKITFWLKPLHDPVSRTKKKDSLLVHLGCAEKHIFTEVIMFKMEVVGVEPTSNAPTYTSLFPETAFAISGSQHFENSS